MDSNRQQTRGNFSPDGKLFALIDIDGKLSIWDTETSELKQQYTPNVFLNTGCTSLIWVNVGASSPRKGNKKARKSMDDIGGITNFIALGTAKGQVALFSYATGKIEYVLKDGAHTGAVTGICYDNKDYIYTSGADFTIIEWSISKRCHLSSWNIGNELPSSLIVIPELNAILTASRQIKLWDLETKNLKQTFTGHTSEITMLKSFNFNSSNYVLSASKMDRILSLWCMKTGSKHKNAVASFLMADIAFSVSCSIDSENILQIAAATRSGVVHYYVEDAEKLKSEKPIKPKVTLEIVSDSSNCVVPVPAIVASLEFSHTNKKILLGYGNFQTIRFENIEPEFTEKNQLLIRSDPRKLTVKSDKGIKSSVFGNMKTIIDEKKVEYLTPVASNKKSSKVPEIPMETRIENLSLGDGAKGPQATNVAQLLIQGLHSNDANMLRLAFSITDEKTISLTLQRLPPQYISSLVNELTSLMRKKTANVKLAVLWLRLLVQTHSSQLLALGKDELFEKFGPCVGIIENRIENLKTLSRARGRLDLLVNQIKRKNIQDDGFDQIDKLLVYQDPDSESEIESEIGDNNSSEDDQWENSDAEEEEEADVIKMEVSDQENGVEESMDDDDDDDDDDDEDDESDSS